MKVSVITPAYYPTVSDYQKTENSLLGQTSKDFEWIIVSDGDGRYNKGDDYYLYDNDIILKENYGPSVARNIGFQISNGDIITYLDMGDIFREDTIEYLIDMFSNHDIDLLFSAYEINYPNGGGHLLDHFNFIGKDYSAFDYIKLLEKQNISIPLGVAHTRKPFVEVGGFQRGIVCGEDGILWRRMWQSLDPQKILFSDKIVGSYFISENGQSRTQRRFSQGGFAYNGSLEDNGSYLDKNWFKTYNSKELFDE